MPIAIPSAFKIKRVRLVPGYTLAAFEPLIGEEKRTDFNAGRSDRWGGVYTFRAEKEADLYAIIAWTRKLRTDAEFYACDPAHRIPFGGVVAGLQVNGGSQTGTTLSIKGGPLSATPLVPGDYIQVGTGFHQLVENLTFNGSGIGTATFWPALRVSPANNDAVITDNPVMVARITSPIPTEIDPQKWAEITISWQEVV
jgi:hypothetical protein